MGERLGRYNLEKKIAAGGMAEVYLARQEGSGNACVIKRMLPELMVDPQFMQMFLDEAKLVAQLHHPQIATVYDFGHEHGVLYLAMEHVEGCNLRALVKDNAKHGKWMAPHHAAAIVAQAARALDYAHHARGIDGRALNLIHRDVSPQNILLGRDGMVKLIDFGVAKANTATQRTAAGMIKGKFAYMSPEQIRGQQLDGRSDLFGLGLVLYELLANMRAVPGVSDAEMAQNALAMKITPIAQVRPDLPPQLLKTLDKVLQRDRNHRHARGNELAVELEAYVHQVAPRFHPNELGALLSTELLPGGPPHPKLALATPFQAAAMNQPAAPLMGATVKIEPAVVQGAIRRQEITVDGPTLPPGEVIAPLGRGPIPSEALGISAPTDPVVLAATALRGPSGARSAPAPVIAAPISRGQPAAALPAVTALMPPPAQAPVPALIPNPAGPVAAESTFSPSMQRAVRPSRGPWIAIGVIFFAGLGLILWALLRPTTAPPAPLNEAP